MKTFTNLLNNKKLKFGGVIEIIDLRAVLTTSISLSYKDFFKYFQGKYLFYILNKADLADDKITKAWEKYFKKTKKNFLICSLKKEKKQPNKFKKKFFTKLNEAFMEQKILFLIVGLPNVGKSTFINILRQKKVAAIGNNPGITKGIQLIKLKDNFYLLDTPGILPILKIGKITNKEIILVKCFLLKIFLNSAFLYKATNFLFIFLVEFYPLNFYSSFKDFFFFFFSDKMLSFSKFLIVINKVDFDVFLAKLTFFYNLKKKNNLLDLNRGMFYFVNKFWKGIFKKISLEKPL